MEVELYKGEKSFTAELNVDQDTGEVIGGEYLEMLVQRNPVGTIAYVLSENAKKKMIDARIKQLEAASKVIENNAERAKKSLYSVMKASGTTRIESADKTFKAIISPGRDKSVEVFNDEQIPSDYLREIPAKSEPDKALIKKAIEDGYEVAGARIVAKDRLTLS